MRQKTHNAREMPPGLSMTAEGSHGRQMHTGNFVTSQELSLVMHLLVISSVCSSAEELLVPPVVSLHAVAQARHATLVRLVQLQLRHLHHHTPRLKIIIVEDTPSQLGQTVCMPDMGTAQMRAPSFQMLQRARLSATNTMTVLDSTTAKAATVVPTGSPGRSLLSTVLDRTATISRCRSFEEILTMLIK